MRMPIFWAGWFISTAMKKPVDVYIGGEEDPYLIRRFIIPRNKLFNIYFHIFMRSDDDRALHDHPWWNISLLLRGYYFEHLPKSGSIFKAAPDEIYFVRRTAGELVFRGAKTSHRIRLAEDETGNPIPAVTLFITGPRLREWGFYCTHGWKHWKDFTSYNTTGTGNKIGPGCGE